MEKTARKKTFFQYLKRLFANNLKKVKFLFNGGYRSVNLTEKSFHEHYFQRSFFTHKNRYPKLFERCKLYFINTPSPKILSFGCSTGEEVFTIGKYMPKAKVVGVDLNDWCLEQARLKFNNPRFSFLNRLSEEFKNENDFDAIFCMAIFQRKENRRKKKEISQGLTFDQFQNELSVLNSKLKPGGLFIIDHSDFRFTDATICQQQFEPLPFKGNKKLRKRPQFDANNKKIDDVQDNFRMFVKGMAPNL